MINLKVIISEFQNEIRINKYFEDNNICFLDIETTGLSRKYNCIYLVGLLYYNDESGLWVLKQLFADTINAEKDLLEALIELIHNKKNIITYNGDSFDIPFINARLLHWNIDFEISKENSFDLYRIVKSYKYLLKLDNLKLKTLERSLGIYRDDIYSGKDCIDFYFDYIKTGNTELKERVLKHNYDDLYYMPYIMKILDIIDEERSISISSIDYPLTLYIDDMKILGDHFIINGSLANSNHNNIIHYYDNYKVVLDNNTFEISMEHSIGLVSPTEKGYYLDKTKVDVLLGINDNTHFALPNNILLLKVEKKYCIGNIKEIIKHLVTSLIRS